MLEGGPFDPERIPPEWRDYQLVSLFGWTDVEIDAADAAKCDWYLAFARVENEVRRAAMTKATKPRG